MRFKKENGLRMLLTAGLIAIILLLVPYGSYSNFDGKDVTGYYGEGVTIQIGQEAEKEVDLAEYSFTIPKKGDVITLSKKMEGEPIEQATFIVELYHCIVECYLDDQLIYSYGEELDKKDIALGHEYLRIPLPDDYTGKLLKLKLTVTEDNSLTSLNNFYITSAKNSYTDTFRNNYVGWMTSMTLLVVGIVGIIVSLSRKRYSKDIRTLTWLCCFAILISMWMLCNSHLIGFLIENSTICNIFEYYSVYMGSIPAALFFANIHSNPRYRRVNVAYAVVLSSLVAITVPLDLIFHIHYVIWIPYAQGFILVMVIASIYMLISSIRKGDQTHRIVAYGMLFMAFVVVVELVRFNVVKYVSVDALSNRSYMPLGAFAFVISMAYCYCRRLLQSILTDAEQKILKRMAYTDFMTGLNNRNHCEYILQELMEKKELGCLVTFDLNLLKHTNDTYGHAEGDRLLKNFARLLQESFEEEAVLGRMGGDEFIAIMKSSVEADVKRCLSKLDEKIQKENKQQDRIAISVAYGYEMACMDKDTSYEEIYKRADAKMYIEKQKMKEKSEQAP